MIEVHIPGAAATVLRDSQLPHDRPDVQRALEGATSFKRGRGRIVGIRASVDTLTEIAEYLEEAAQLDAEMTFEESTASGRADARAARAAAERIRYALSRCPRCGMAKHPPDRWCSGVKGQLLP